MRSGAPNTVIQTNRWMQPVRMDLPARVLAGGLALGCCILLLLAAWIDPARSGTGSHLQIGLPPCGFMERTALPCGTCGMTTSFAHFVRGNLLASLYVQPFGFVLAVATGATAWIAGYCALTARPAYRALRRVSWGWTGSLLLSVWLASWGWKMWVVLRGADGW